MSFGSKLWPSRSSASATAGPRTALARVFLGSKAKPAPASKAGAADLLFDSFAARAEREFSRNEPSEDAASPSAAATVEADGHRQADRYTPVQAITTLVDSKGKRHRARIINFSATGVAIEADFKAVDADSVTHVGSMRVSSGRAMRQGMVYLFEKPLDPTRCGPTTIL